MYVHTLQTISDYKAALQYTRTAEVLQVNATLGLIRYAMNSTTADFTAYGRQFLLPDFSLYLDYTLIKHHELGLSLVRRNEIPSLWDLTPILNNSNRLWMNIGNPSLNVGSAYRLGLRYKWKNPRSDRFWCLVLRPIWYEIPSGRMCYWPPAIPCITETFRLNPVRSYAIRPIPVLTAVTAPILVMIFRLNHCA
ncbi:MAG: outer membrane beta-barrel protein [Bacteroidota bacterium]|nr:MAG: outer membrane beta-barrel protein [Bacteroidota bacterium]